MRSLDPMASHNSLPNFQPVLWPRSHLLKSPFLGEGPSNTMENIHRNYTLNFSAKETMSTYSSNCILEKGKIQIVLELWDTGSKLTLTPETQSAIMDSLSEWSIERSGNKWITGLIPSYSRSMGLITYPLVISPVSECVIWIHKFSTWQNFHSSLWSLE